MTLYRDYSDAAPISPADWRLRGIDIAERVCICAAFLWYFYANWITNSWLNVCIASIDLIIVGFVLFRKPATSVSMNPADWALAFGGTLLTMFARPGGTPLFSPAVAICLASAGMMMSVAAKLSLNRRFGVTPANRGVQMRGAYVFVRHPMYLGYVLIHGAYLVTNPTAYNAALIAFTWILQAGRILREERWLMQDRGYRRYARVVRFRFIPCLF